MSVLTPGDKAILQAGMERLSDGCYASHSALATTALGSLYADYVAPVTFLDGYLGAGKTTFVKGLAEGLGITDDVTSPTFAIESLYSYAAARGDDGAVQEYTLHHFDLYRIEHGDELQETGIFEAIHEAYLGDSDIVLVEWGERFRGSLAHEFIRISIESQAEADNERLISLQAEGAEAERKLKAYIALLDEVIHG